MEKPLEAAFRERVLFLKRVKTFFEELYPERPKTIRRGETQKKILEKMAVPLTGFNKRNVSEVLESFGYRKVKIQGYLYYSKV